MTHEELLRKSGNFLNTTGLISPHEEQSDDLACTKRWSRIEIRSTAASVFGCYYMHWKDVAGGAWAAGTGAVASQSVSEALDMGYSISEINDGKV